MFFGQYAGRFPFSFVISAHFVPETVLGYGSFGVVVGVRDSRTGESLALKKISAAFRDECEVKRLLREFQVMDQLRHPNVLSLRYFYMDNLEDVYFVSDRMDTNLKCVIDFDLKKLSLRHIKYVLYQILCGLKCIHECGLIHR